MLIWTNPNPTANFAAQILTETDVTGYDYLKVEYLTISSDTTRRMMADISVLCTNPYVENLNCIRNLAAGVYNHTRTCYITSDNHIAFGNAVYMIPGGTTTNTSNDCLVPLRIWGCKF